MDESITSNLEIPGLSIQEILEMNKFVENFFKNSKINDVVENNSSLNKFSHNYFMIKNDFIMTMDSFLKLGQGCSFKSYKDILNYTLANHEARQNFYCSFIQEKALDDLLKMYVNFCFKLAKEIIVKNYELFNQIIDSAQKQFNSSDLKILNKYNEKTSNNLKIKKLPLKLYNIIPVPLIKGFCFRLSNNLEFMKKYCAPSNSNFKIQLSKLIKKYELLEQLSGKINSRIDGNVFWGPEHRNPFLPQFSKDCKELYASFEINSAHVLGKSKYEALFSIFLQIVEYMSLRPNEDKVLKGSNKEEEEKLLAVYTDGIDLCELLIETFEQFKTLPDFDMDRWDHCELTLEESSKLEKNELDKKFWDYNKKEIFFNLL